MISSAWPVVTSSAIVSPVIVLCKMPIPPRRLAMVTFSNAGIGSKSGHESGVFGRSPAHMRSVEPGESVGRNCIATVSKCQAPSAETELLDSTSALGILPQRSHGVLVPDRNFLQRNLHQRSYVVPMVTVAEMWGVRRHLTHP